jgi:5-methylcytosine-specific restriction endonuclease McrA
LVSSDSYAGENNPNYKGGKESTECMICGETFEYYPSEKPGRFCSTCVATEQWQTPPGLSGPDHPHWSGGKIEASCEVCGATVRRNRSALKNKTVLCSRECQSVWFSETYTGENHPNWKGGGNEAYGKGWRRAKPETLDRDDHTCVICGKTTDEIGRNPDVHHIVPVRSFVNAPDADKTDAHVPRNLVTLCVTCHRRADFGEPSKAELKQLVDVRST